MNKSTGFWGSFEVYCVSADLPYTDYVRLHTSSGFTSGKLSLVGYAILGSLLNSEIKESIEKHND